MNRNFEVHCCRAMYIEAQNTRATSGKVLALALNRAGRLQSVYSAVRDEFLTTRIVQHCQVMKPFLCGVVVVVQSSGLWCGIRSGLTGALFRCLVKDPAVPSPGGVEKGQLEVPGGL